MDRSGFEDDDAVPRFFLSNDPEVTKGLLEKVERELGRDPNPRVAAVYRELAYLVSCTDTSGMLEEIINGGEE